MRTITLYKFDELSDTAKEKAMDEVRYVQEYFWGDDAIKSLQEVAKHFGAELADYDIDFSNSVQHGGATFVDKYFLEEDELEKKLEEAGSYNPKTLKGLGDCNFTGYGGDEDVIDGIRKAWFDGERDVIELLKAGYKTWFASCVSDYEYQLSKEGLTDFFEANDGGGYEFTEDGQRWKR